MFGACQRAAVILSLLLFPVTSSADQMASVSVDTAQVIGGWSYKYTLTVAPTSTSQIAALLINLQPGVSVSNPTGPANMSFAVYEPSNLTGWETPFPQFMVQPGSTATFEFQSAFAPGTVNLSIGGYSTSNGFPTQYRGVIQGPVLPEPATIATIAVAATAVSLRRHR